MRALRVVLAAAFVVALIGVPVGPAAAAPGYHAAWVSQDPWPTVVSGELTTYSVRLRNTGDQPWQRGVAGRQVNLGVTGDSAAFAQLGMAVNWLAADRPATHAEAVVGPGEIATFTFSVRAPLAAGTYRIPLHPVLEGVAHLEDEGVYLVVVSASPFRSRWVSQSPFPTLPAGQVSAPLTIAFRNAGTRDWVKGGAGSQANLGINGDDRSFAAYGVGWPSADRPAIQNEATVRPGETGTFTFQVRGPSIPGTYRLDLRPVIDGVTWMDDEGAYLLVVVPGTGAAPQLTATVVQGGLRNAWDVAFAPDGRMFVTERVGNLLAYASASAGAAQLSNTAIAGVRAEGEAGLMGVTLDPAFASNGYVYVCVSRTDQSQWLNQVLRYRMEGNNAAFDGYVIRDDMRANSNHDGCRIRFGPDGKLWVTMGDRGDPNNAQDPDSFNGKVLRVNSDGSIPSDNPVIAGSAGRSAVYTWGNRNPQGLAFQPGTGAAWEVEHGDGTHDEINVLAAGANYGYPIVRGAGGASRGFVDPAWSSGGITLATSGADFVSGAAWGSWSGSLMVASLKESDLRRFSISGGTATQREILYNGTYGRLRTARLAPDGSLYLTTDNGSGDRVVRISPSP